MKITPQHIIPLVFCPSDRVRIRLFLPAGVIFLGRCHNFPAGKKQPISPSPRKKRSVCASRFSTKLTPRGWPFLVFSPLVQKTQLGFRLVVFGPEGKKTRNYPLGVKYILSSSSLSNSTQQQPTAPLALRPIRKAKRSATKTALLSSHKQTKIN